MNTVAQITPHLRNVEAPTAIRDTPAWVIWRFEYDQRSPKPLKVPYYANGARRSGKQGGPSDLASLVTFDAAKRAAARRGFDGVGFATLKQFGICALDFDNCVTDGKVHPDIEPLLADTYAEYSPSGQGIRIFFKGDLGDSKSHDGPFGMEVFSCKGFVTFTGNTLDVVELIGNDDTVADITPSARKLYDSRFAKRDWQAELVSSDTPPVGLTNKQVVDCLDRIDPDCSHDDWLHAGMGTHHETGGAGFELWDQWSAKGSKYPGTEALQRRWDSFGKNPDRLVTMRTVMKLAGMSSAPGSADPDEFESLVDQETQAVEKGIKPPRFEFLPAHEFANVTALPWIIKGVLPKAGLAVMYGASGSGKSFAALDMSMAIARGSEWRMRRVKQGRVAYIAAEGADGFRKRLVAYAKSKDVDLSTIPMTVLKGSPNMMEVKDAVDLAVGVEMSGGADVIVVDTFAQVTPGANENAGEHIGKALGHCKRLHELTGALVLLIHHSGKDQTKGARGWSGLRAAADAEIEVTREATGRCLRLTKNKDGEDGQEWGFDLDIVEIGIDEDMDPITSCVVVETAVPAKGGVAERKLGKNERVVNEVIQEIAASQTTGIEIAFVIEEATRRIRERDGIEKDPKGNAKSMARRALNRLCDGDDAPYFLDETDNTISVC